MQSQPSRAMMWLLWRVIMSTSDDISDKDSLELENSDLELNSDLSDIGDSLSERESDSSNSRYDSSDTTEMSTSPGTQ